MVGQLDPAGTLCHSSGANRRQRVGLVPASPHILCGVILCPGMGTAAHDGWFAVRDLELGSRMTRTRSPALLSVWTWVS